MRFNRNPENYWSQKLTTVEESELSLSYCKNADCFDELNQQTIYHEFSTRDLAVIYQRPDGDQRRRCFIQAKELGRANAPIGYTDRGRPFVKGSNLSFSFSNKLAETLVGAVNTPLNLGVDIENFSELESPEVFVKYSLTSKEKIQFIKTQEALELTPLQMVVLNWSTKESLAKAQNQPFSPSEISLYFLGTGGLMFSAPGKEPITLESNQFFYSINSEQVITAVVLDLQ